MLPETRETLEILVQKAGNLGTGSFANILERSLEMRWDIERKSVEFIEEGLPPWESVAAMVLDFRQFIQNNDSISFQNLEAMSDPSLSEHWQTEVARVRSELNGYLDAPPNMTYWLDGDAFAKRREIMEMFIYGFLAHTNRQKYRRYTAWASEPFLYPLVRLEFESTVRTTLGAIFYVATLARRELGWPG